MRRALEAKVPLEDRESYLLRSFLVHCFEGADQLVVRHFFLTNVGSYPLLLSSFDEIAPQRPAVNAAPIHKPSSPGASSKRDGLSAVANIEKGSRGTWFTGAVDSSAAGRLHRLYPVLLLVFYLMIWFGVLAALSITLFYLSFQIGDRSVTLWIYIVCGAVALEFFVIETLALWVRDVDLLCRLLGAVRQVTVAMTMDGMIWGM